MVGVKANGNVLNAKILIFLKEINAIFAKNLKLIKNSVKLCLIKEIINFLNANIIIMLIKKSNNHNNINNNNY